MTPSSSTSAQPSDRFARTASTSPNASSTRPSRRASASPVGGRYSIFARTIIWDWPMTRAWYAPPGRAWTIGVSAWRPYVSFAVRRACTSNLKQPCPNSWVPTTASSTAAASMPTAACSKRCSARKTPSSATNSTMRASSTAFACARPSATGIATTTWPTCPPSWRKRTPRARDSR